MQQNQNNSNPQSKNSMIIWIVILVIVIIVVIGIAGFYFYKIGTQESSVQTQPSGLNTESVDNLNVKTKTTTPTATSSPTTTGSSSNWQTYYNSRFGYSVKEPAGFSKFESQNGDGASFSLDNPAVGIGVYGANNIENLSATQYLNKEFSTLQMETPDAKEISWNNVNMDGCEGEKRAWQYSPTTGGGQDIEAMAICIKNEFVYGIYMTLNANDYSAYSKVFDELVSSFKFGK